MGRSEGELRIEVRLGGGGLYLCVQLSSSFSPSEQNDITNKSLTDTTYGRPATAMISSTTSGMVRPDVTIGRSWKS